MRVQCALHAHWAVAAAAAAVYGTSLIRMHHCAAFCWFGYGTFLAVGI
jgi:hypothetical protein